MNSSRADCKSYASDLFPYTTGAAAMSLPLCEPSSAGGNAHFCFNDANTETDHTISKISSQMFGGLDYYSYLCPKIASIWQKGNIL
jgi:hypothetical protein